MTMCDVNNTNTLLFIFLLIELSFKKRKNFILIDFENNKNRTNTFVKLIKQLFMFLNSIKYSNYNVNLNKNKQMLTCKTKNQKNSK